jgi:acetyltransferase-like isoleucine patch superfamily enzyme
MLKKLFEAIQLKFASTNKRAKIYQKKGVVMGKNCQIFGDVSFGSEPYLVKLGDYVKITYGCLFITHDGGVEVLRNLGMLENAEVFGRITIGNNVFIGNRCTFLPNVTIGDNVVIGTGSIVTKDIPSNSIAAGVPCRVIKTLEEYYEKCKTAADYTKNMDDDEKGIFLIKKYT